MSEFTTTTFLRVRDLLEKLKNYPDALICIEGSDDRLNMLTACNLETVYETEEGDLSYSWEDDIPESFSKKEEIILLGESWNYIFNVEKLQKIQLEKEEQIRRNYEEKIKNFLHAERLLQEPNEFTKVDLPLKDRIELFLKIYGLGDSGRGASPLEIKNHFELTDSKIREILFELSQENKIKSTGKTKGIRYCVIELYEQALKIENAEREKHLNVRNS